VSDREQRRQRRVRLAGLDLRQQPSAHAEAGGGNIQRPIALLTSPTHLDGDVFALPHD
jgi:hypothetical protein